MADVLDEPTDGLEAAFPLLRQHAGLAGAVGHGESQAIAATQDDVVTVANFDVDVARKTGGGDRFDAGMAYALAGEWTWEDALRLGNAWCTEVRRHRQVRDAWGTRRVSPRTRLTTLVDDRHLYATPPSAGETTRRPRWPSTPIGCLERPPCWGQVPREGSFQHYLANAWCCEAPGERRGNEKSFCTVRRISIMSYLDDISADDLHQLLDAADGKKPTLRVVAAINYKNGVTPTDIAQWYGLSRSTVYNWLERLERLPDESPETVLVDADRPGRPPKLAADQRADLRQSLAEPPREAGVDADEWSPTVLQRVIETRYGVKFSVRHARNLLRELE